MRFNPPPNWPTPPEGWEPPPGWTPDPSLPAPPPGWQLWVDGPAPTSVHDQHRKHAVRSFWIGIAFFVASAVAITIASREGGGVLWYGGLLVGVASFVRAVVSYRESLKAGVPPLAPRGMAVAGLAVLVALVAGGVAVASFAETSNLQAHVGSCWKEDDGQAVLVPCSAGHGYVATDEVATDSDCPDTTVAVVDGDAEDVLCLVED